MYRVARYSYPESMVVWFIILLVSIDKSPLNGLKHEVISSPYSGFFRSQTSDNMDRWKSRGGKSQRREEKRRREKIRKRRERVRRKKMQVCEKVEKWRTTVFFQWFVAPEVESRLAKAAGAEPSGEMKDEKLHATAARSMFPSQNVQNTPSWKHFWKLTCRKSAKLLQREAHFQVKMYQAPQCRTTFGSWHVEKVQAVVARSIFPKQNVKSTTCSDHFEGLDVVLRGRRKGFCTSPKVNKTWGFCNLSNISKNEGRTFAEVLERCVSRGRQGTQTTQDMFIRDVRRSGRWFPENGCILEHQIIRFAKMILLDRCGTSYDFASLFRGRRNTLDRCSGKIPKRIGTRLSSALNFPFLKEV